MYRACLIPIVLTAAFQANAQPVISAQSGLLHHTEGRVLLGEKVVETKFGEFPEIREGQEFRTERGRAEVLLSPGVFLRIGENSAIKMISRDLEDTRVELIEGSVLVESADLVKDNEVRLLHAGTEILLRKAGLYCLDSQPARLRVYDGEAQITSGDVTVKAKKGRIVSLDGELSVDKFDTDDTDPLYRWSGRRASYLAMASVSSAKYLRESDERWRRAGWRWNPYFGMVTFIPNHRSYQSAFGPTFWCPQQVGQLFEPRQVYAPRFPGYNPDLGYTTVPRTASAPSVSAPGPAASPAPAPESPRTSDAATPRGGDDGGRSR